MLVAKIFPKALPETLQRTFVLSYNPNVYLEETKNEAIRTKTMLSDTIEQAHSQMIQAIQYEKTAQEVTYHISQDIIAKALSGAESLHDHHSIWLWPKELAPLFFALQNPRGVIIGHDANNNHISTFYSWNFPLHKLQATLDYYHYDTSLNDSDNESEMAISYKQLSNQVESLCFSRFKSICTLFNTSKPMEACTKYHDMVKMLKKLDE